MLYTYFDEIYEAFYSQITDDMYMELTREETDALTFELMRNAIHWFEFPRVNIYDYNQKAGRYNIALSTEEINVIATYMVVEWLGQQLASVEMTRMKYSGSDFKFTSQANHIAKLIALKKEYERKGFHLQRLYKRRKADKNGRMRSTMRDIMSGPSKSEELASTGMEWGEGPQVPDDLKEQDIWEDEPITYWDMHWAEEDKE